MPDGPQPNGTHGSLSHTGGDADGIVRPRTGDATLAEALLVPPGPANHASFAQLLPDGSLGCAWFAGAAEGRPDVYIHFSRLPAGADRWLPPVRVSRDAGRSEQNPVLATLPDGGLWLLYTSQEYGAQDTSVVMHQRSDDLGATWSPPRVLFTTPGVFVRNGLVRTAPGRWLLPLFHCHQLPGRQWHGHADTSAVALTDDDGASWREVPVPGSTGAVHMSVVPLRDGAGTLAAFFRSRWADAVHRSVSADGGETWSEPVPLPVPNNNSSLQVAQAAPAGAGRDALFMVCNPVSAPLGAADGDDHETASRGKVTAPGTRQPLARHAVWGVPRLPLSLLSSADGGLSWHHVLDLETADTAPPWPAGGRGPEMSYPTLVPGTGGELHVTYTYLRQAIKYVRVPPERLAPA